MEVSSGANLHEQIALAGARLANNQTKQTGEMALKLIASTAIAPLASPVTAPSTSFALNTLGSTIDTHA